MSRRPHMLASVIRDIVAPALHDAPQKCGVVSISEVEVSPDFSYATVYITALYEPQAALEYLEGRRNRLQKAIGEVPRAKLPQLRFRIDRRTEQANRIEELLDDLNE